jgi:hypothetical protein
MSNLKTYYRKKNERIPHHFLTPPPGGFKEGHGFQMGGAPEPQPGEPPPGMPAWQGLGESFKHPMGAFVNYPSLQGGYTSPINLNQAPPVMQAMAAQQPHQQGYAQGGQAEYRTYPSTSVHTTIGTVHLFSPNR